MRAAHTSSKSPLLALALAAALAACGKSEPPPPPPPPTAPVLAEGPVAPPAARAAEDAATPPAVPAAPAKPEAAAPAPVPPEATPKGGEIQAVTLPSIPPEVGVVAGTPGLAQLVGGFARAARTVDNDAPLPPNPLAALLEAARMRFRLTDTAWIDTERPVRVVVPDQKANPSGFVVILPVRAPEAMVRAGLGKHLGAAAGHGGQLAADGGGPAIFVDFDVAEHVVLSTPDGLWAQLKPYVTDTVMAWTPPQTLSAEVSVTNLRRIYTEELAATHELATLAAKHAAERMPIPSQAKTLTSLVDAGFDFLLEADRFGVAIEPGEGVARVAFGVRGVEGTELAARIADHGGREIDLLGAVAPTAWLGAAWDLAPKAILAEPAAVGAAFSELLGEPVSDADAAMLAGHFKALTELAGGDAALSLGTDGAFPVAMEVTSGETDGAAAKAHLVAVLDWLAQRGIARLKAQLAEGGAAPEALKLDSVADAIATVNQLGAALGIGLVAIDEERAGAAVSGIRLTIDWDRMALAKSNPELAAAAATLVGPRLEAVIASAKERVVAAFGPNAAERAAKLAVGGAEAGQPQLARVGADAFLAVTLRVGALLQAFARLPALAPRAAVIAKLPADEAFALDARSDKATTTVTLHVPMALLTALITAEW